MTMIESIRRRAEEAQASRLYFLHIDRVELAALLRLVDAASAARSHLDRRTNLRPIADALDGLAARV